MGFLQGLKEKIYYHKLNKLIKASKGDAVRFTQAQHIGILFDATDDTDCKVILNFEKDLTQRRRKVSLLGYVNSNEKELPETGYTYFNRRGLKFDLTPKDEKAIEFMKQPFDILFCLHTKHSLPLEFIAAASNAKFKIGHYIEEQSDVYDFMVYGKSKSIRAVIQQMERYLEKIN